MAFIRDLSLGLDGFFKAFRFALRHGLGWIFLAPALLWLVLAYGLFQVLEGPVEEVARWAAGLLSIPADDGHVDEGFWSTAKAFLSGAWGLLTLVLLKVAVGYILFKVNKYLVLVLLSPLLAYASERAEEILSGRQFPFSWTQLLRDALRGSLVALRNGILEVAMSIAIWGLTLMLPLLAPLSAVVLFLVSAYFYGFSMFDYVYERRRLRIGETVRAVNDRLGAVLANGACFSLLMKVPLLGMMLAPGMAAVGAVMVMRPQGLSAQV